MTEIHIENINLYALIGTEPKERKHKQKLQIDLSFIYQQGKGKAFDHLVNVVDYEQVARKMIQEVQVTKFHLIETLARFILDFIMQDRRIKQATVKISKPNALGKRANIAVTERRKR